MYAAAPDDSINYDFILETKLIPEKNIYNFTNDPVAVIKLNQIDTNRGGLIIFDSLNFSYDSLDV